MRNPEALLVELLSAAGILLEHDEPFWYAVDTRGGGALAQGGDARQVAHEALAELRRRHDALAAAAGERSRAVAGAGPPEA